MAEAAIGLGSNVGDRLGFLRSSAALIAKLAGTIRAKSDVYESEPWGVADQPKFLNACVVLETELSPFSLLEELKNIEAHAGRVDRGRWGPREIDLDIIFYGDLIIDGPVLRIPHAFAAQRNFVVIPLSEIAPDLTHPEDGRTMRDISSGMSRGGMVRITRL
jgi:2-amino-4-hydroxy-6-hydroxymethyldihydropteridine diphosphokinase